jgi:hypothetical protein
MVGLNDVVWFWKDGEGRGRNAEPAIVTDIDEAAGMVDLWVFCGHGGQRTETKVALKGNPEDLPYAVPGGEPRVRYATLELHTKEPEPEEAEEEAA